MSLIDGANPFDHEALAASGEVDTVGFGQSEYSTEQMGEALSALEAFRFSGRSSEDLQALAPYWPILNYLHGRGDLPPYLTKEQEHELQRINVRKLTGRDIGQYQVQRTRSLVPGFLRRLFG